MKAFTISFIILAISNIALGMSEHKDDVRVGDMRRIGITDDSFKTWHTKLNHEFEKNSFKFMLYYDKKDNQLLLSLHESSKEARIGIGSNSVALTSSCVIIFNGIPKFIEIKEKSTSMAFIPAETKVLFNIGREELLQQLEQ